MRLVSFYGNEVVYTEDEKKIKRLEEQGFRQQELPSVKEELPERKGAKKNGNGKRKTKPQRDI